MGCGQSQEDILAAADQGDDTVFSGMLEKDAKMVFEARDHVCVTLRAASYH